MKDGMRSCQGGGGLPPSPRASNRLLAALTAAPVRTAACVVRDFGGRPFGRRPSLLVLGLTAEDFAFFHSNLTNKKERTNK